MDTEVYKFRLDKWRKLVYEANACGMKKTEWCRMNGISTKQFYYWQKRVRAQALEEMQGGTGMGVSMQGDGLPAQLPSFVELKPPAQPCCSRDVDTPVDAPDAPAPLTLNLKDCQLQIRGNASESLLRMVVKVLRDA